MPMPPCVGSVGSISGFASMPCRFAFSAVRRKLATDSPGTEIGFWKARNMPRRARLSAESARMLRPFQVTSPFVIR